MDNIFLEEFQHISLTKNQRKIAQYCIDHQYRICQETLSELAANVGVTEVTVLNFVRKLGYKGFAEFKSNVYARVMAQVNRMQLPLGDRMQENESRHQDSTSIEAYMEIAMKNLESSMLQNKQESYQQAADWIAQAKRVFVIGTRVCASGAAHFARLLIHLQNNVVCIPSNDISYTLLEVSGAETDDVVIMFCKKRYYKTDVALCKLVREVGARLILVTDSILAPMVSYADLFLLSDANGVSFFDSAIGFTAIQEYLAELVVERSDDTVKQRWKLVDSYTDEGRF